MGILKDLYEKRRQSYAAAIPYHDLMAEAADILFTARVDDAILIVERFNEAADEYERALLLLLDHLQTQPQTDSTDREIRITHRLLAVIHRERDLVNGQFGKRDG